jgi:FAD/FMN-containing dehydrogenase
LKNLHVEQFRKIVGDGILAQAAGDDLSPFLTDWTGKFEARSPANDFVVLRPKTTGEVSEILKFCNEEK